MHEYWPVVSELKFKDGQNFVSTEKPVACVECFFPAEPQATYWGDILGLEKTSLVLGFSKTACFLFDR